jgi:hypothetical protein
MGNPLDVEPESGQVVGGAERMRQQSQPLSQQSVDLLRTQTVADCLEPLRIVAFQHAVIECFESDSFVRQLLFRVLMPVQAEFGVIGEISAELEEERSEIPIHTVVDVEMVHRRLLLRLADKDNALGLFELLPLFGRDVLRCPLRN